MRISLGRISLVTIPQEAAMRMNSAKSQDQEMPGDWNPVLGVIKDGVTALRVLPVLAMILAVLAWLITHQAAVHPDHAATAASCLTCADR